MNSDTEVWFSITAEGHEFHWKMEDQWRDFFEKHRSQDGSWEDWVEPLEILWSDIEEYNGKHHCIFGQMEAISQSGRLPVFVHEHFSDELTISLYWREK